MRKDPGEWKRILCMCLSGVGDALTFTPFLRLLKQSRPDLEVEVLVMFKASQQMMEKNLDVAKVHFVDFLNDSAFKSLANVLKLRRNKYDATVAAYPANRAEYNIVQLLLGGRRIGHRYCHHDLPNLNWLKNNPVMEDETKHVVENNVALLPFCGVEIPSDLPALDFPLDDADIEFAGAWKKEHLGGGRRTVGVHAGTAVFKNHINRRWALSKFAALAARLVDEADCDVLVFGGPDEIGLKGEIVDTAARPGRVLAVDDTTLRQSAALIKLCDLMVSNDSSLMHVSAAMQTPVVAVFAYTNPVFVHPWKAPHRVVRHEMPCSPCFYYSPRPAQCRANLDYACIRGIGVEEVFAACSEMLDTIGMTLFYE